MENRFQIARDHLLDLLKYYGNRTILVKITQDGKEVKVWAKTFVRRRIEKTGIPFIFGTGSNRIVRVTNPELDDDMLAVIFHKAVFELERGYIEVFSKGDHKHRGSSTLLMTGLSTKRNGFHVPSLPIKKRI